MKTLGSIILMMLLAITASIAQDKGVKFEETLTLQQLKEKAKTENKYIFIDVMATWCVPCKQMDKEVYTAENVGTVMNSKFISVKAQIDKGANDSEHTKNWYATAEELSKEYKIMALPTYLFFSPDGNIVHKGTGYLAPDDFLKLANNALNPNEQFYSKYTNAVNNYRKGDKNFDIMPALIATADDMGHVKLRDSLINDYMYNYLFKKSDDELFTKANMEFISRNAGRLTSKDRFFKLMYADKVKHALADSVLGMPGWAASVVKVVIYNEEINDHIYKDGKIINLNPNWKAIQATISKKYNPTLAEKYVLSTQIGFYKTQKDWKKYAAVFDQNLKKFPPKPNKAGQRNLPESFEVNAAAWEIFLKSNEKWLLEKALSWSEQSLKFDEEPNVQYYDTKSNLLYKLGRVEEAIATEEFAIAQDRAFVEKYYKLKKGFFEDPYKATIEKMKKGEPTWGEGVQ
ncbi:hypothetical protein C3K47_05150 [Solitalea longa]|uniref:Thioredoxin domain-containing protein n=1 Tax=Solitalea longa TaxID=2079460 RepID=A0A2S5A5U3_9SPHI|nr:thioredoxin fold domain-containing protein [Solitalea longa]POY37915.1 hypothetical protein C3K47_05150 [Solitalea longa]